MIGAALDEQIEQLMHPLCPTRADCIDRDRGGCLGDGASLKSAPTRRPGSPRLSIWLVGAAVPRQPRIGRQTPSRCPPHGQPAPAAGPGRVRGRRARDGYLLEYYRRQVRKFGGTQSAANKKAIAVAHKLIVIIWHVLYRPAQDGADYFTTAWIRQRTTSPRRQTRSPGLGVA